VRGTRISHNGRHGYYQHNIRNDPEPAREIVIESNEIWKNGVDGIHLGAPMVDASIIGNRIRNNGRRRAPAARGAGVYTEMTLKDPGAHWPRDGHKGKSVLAAGLQALVAANSENELFLFPFEPGAKTAWEKGPPERGTLYLLEDAPPVRAGISIASRIEGAWIRSNRIWDNQESRSQNEDLHVADGGECREV